MFCSKSYILLMIVIEDRQKENCKERILCRNCHRFFWSFCLRTCLFLFHSKYGVTSDPHYTTLATPTPSFCKYGNVGEKMFHPWFFMFHKNKDQTKPVRLLPSSFHPPLTPTPSLTPPPHIFCLHNTVAADQSFQ